MFFSIEDVLGTERDETTGTLLAQLGDVHAEQATSQQAEIWQPNGFASRTANPTKGKAAAQALVLQTGGRDVCVAMRDIRAQSRYGSLKPGETIIYATEGQARVVLKANGAIVAYTTDDNTDDGNAISLTVHPTLGLLFVAPWGTIEFSQTNGFRVRHTTAGDIALAPVTMPAPFDAIGNSFVVTAGICRLEASTVILGAGEALGHCAYGAVPGALTTTSLGSFCVFIASGA